MPSAPARAAWVRPLSSRNRRSRTPTRAFVTTITPCLLKFARCPSVVHRLALSGPAQLLAQVLRASAPIIGLDHRSLPSQVLQNRGLSATNLHTCRSTTPLTFECILLRWIVVSF